MKSSLSLLRAVDAVSRWVDSRVGGRRVPGRGLTRVFVADLRRGLRGTRLIASSNSTVVAIDSTLPRCGRCWDVTTVSSELRRPVVTVESLSVVAVDSVLRRCGGICGVKLYIYIYIYIFL